MIPWDLLSACPHRQFHTLPGILDTRAALSNPYPKACVLCMDAVCTIFMMVFGMTRPGREPATYRMRRGHANHLDNPTRLSTLELGYILEMRVNGINYGSSQLRGGGHANHLAIPTRYIYMFEAKTLTCFLNKSLLTGVERYLHQFIA